MRKSNKILLGIVGAGAAFLVCILIALKIVVSAYIDRSNDVDSADGKIIATDSKNQVTKLYDFKGFDKLKINSNWEIDVKQGNEYKIKIITSKDYDGKVHVYQTDKTLKLSVENIRLGNPKFYAEIIMPDLVEIDCSGAVDVDMSNFNGNKLDIDISGAGKIKGKNCKYNNLSFEASGAAKLDFKDVIVKNCNFDMSGAGKAEVTMNGGTLTGEISGVGNFNYYGKVSSRNVDISGLGKVTEMN